MSRQEAESSLAAITRRGFLVRAGAGAGAVALGGGLCSSPPARSATAVTSPTTFGRMFPNLPAFADATDGVRADLVDLGSPGGLLDAGDDLAAGPVLLITDPIHSVGNPNNPTHTAGTTFVGQFVDHDITFDTGSKLGVPAEPASVRNARSPSLDLDSVYGSGPSGSPQLYDPADTAKLKVGYGGAFEDLPRDGKGVALIGDPRNDEHLIIAGLHAAFLRFHNEAVDVVRSEQPRAGVGKVFITRTFPFEESVRGVANKVTLGEAADNLALPLDSPPRVSPADRWPSGGRRHPRERPPSLQAEARAGVHAGGVPGRLLPLRPLDGAPVLPGQPQG